MTRKKYDRADVVAQAMEVFWRHGFRGTSIGMLCEATGLNPKSLYAEFGSKEALFTAAVDLYTQWGLQQSRSALDSEPLGLHNVRAYFSAMHYEEDCRGCLMTMTINERALVPPAAFERVGETIDAIGDAIRANLEAAELDADDVETLTDFLLFTLQGITTMGKLHGSNARLGRVLQEVARTLDRYDRGGA